MCFYREAQIESYVVVERNVDKDLYAVRPVSGGTERWLNRTLLTLDTRCNFSEVSDPPDLLPEVDSLSETESSRRDDSSDILSSSDDDEVVLIPQNLFLPQVITQKETEKTSRPAKNAKTLTSGPARTDQGSDDSLPLQHSLRRSKRIAKKRGGWHSAIT